MVLATSPRNTPAQTGQSYKSSQWCCKVPWTLFEQRASNRSGSTAKFDPYPLQILSIPKAVSADLEGVFLQMGVIPKDQPSIRFLWREDPLTEVAVFQYVRHIFRSKGSPTCTNNALKGTATDSADKFPRAAQSVQTN